MTERRLYYVGGYLVIAVATSVAALVLGYHGGEWNGLSRTVTAGPGFGGSPLEEATVDRDVSLDFLEDNPNLPRRFFSVRWKGFFYVPHGEGVHVYGGADDRLAVRIDGTTVLERSPELGMGTVSTHVPLTSGAHELEIDYEQHGGNYRLNLQWAPAGGGPRPLDGTALFLAIPTSAQLRTIRQVAALRSVAVSLWLFPLLVIAVMYARRHVLRGAVRRHPASATAVVVFLVAVLVRLVYLFVTTDYPAFAWVDPDGYTRKATLLTESGSWRWTLDAARYQRNYFKAPLYPVFLSVFTQRPDYLWSAALAEAVLSAVGVVAVFLIGRAIHSNRCGILAAGAYAVYYPSLSWLTAFMQERLYVPLLTVALAVLVHGVTRSSRPRVYLLAGGLLGLAALARSMPLYFVGPAAVYVWARGVNRERAPSQAAAVLGGFLLVVAPYCVMLAVQSQQAVAIENIGGYGILRVEPEAREFVTGETPSVTEVARILWHRFQRAPLSYPLGLLQTALGSLQSSVGRGLQWSWSFPTLVTAQVTKVIGHLTGDLLFLGVIGLAPFGVLLARQKLAARLLGLWIAVHLLFTALAGYGGPRFREPIEPLLFVLAACVVAGGWQRATRRSVVGVALLSATLAWPGVRTLPYSLSSHADYGVGVWSTTDDGRASSTTAPQSGFNLRSPRTGEIEFRLWALQPGDGAEQVVEMRIDGVRVADVEVGQRPRRVRYAGSNQRMHFVELAATHESKQLTFGLELFDHSAGVGR